MTICSSPKLEVSSLRDLLRQKSPDFYLQESNDCFRSVIHKFEDCPEALVDFCHSDWMNMAEPYHSQLLDRWEQNRGDIVEMFSEFLEAYGYATTLEALENCSIEDPEDMAIQMVNCAMTYAAQTLADVLEETF